MSWPGRIAVIPQSGVMECLASHPVLAEWGLPACVSLLCSSLPWGLWWARCSLLSSLNSQRSQSPSLEAPVREPDTVAACGTGGEFDLSKEWVADPTASPLIRAHRLRFSHPQVPHRQVDVIQDGLPGT